MAPERDRDRLKALLPRFSTEDLLRSFDLLSKAESDIRYAAEPRYHLEMALLRWIHARKLTPLSDLIEQLRGSGPMTGTSRPAPGGGVSRPSAAPPSGRPAPTGSASVAQRVAQSPASRPAAPARPATPPAPAAGPAPERSVAPARAPEPDRSGEGAVAPRPAPAPNDFVAAFLEALRKDRPGTFGTLLGTDTAVVLGEDRVTLHARAFQAGRLTAERAWLESVARRVAGRPIAVAVETVSAPSSGAGGASGASKDELMAAARNAPAVQTVLEIFPAEIKNVTELS